MTSILQHMRQESNGHAHNSPKSSVWCIFDVDGRVPLKPFWDTRDNASIDNRNHQTRHTAWYNNIQRLIWEAPFLRWGRTCRPSDVATFNSTFPIFIKSNRSNRSSKQRRSTQWKSHSCHDALRRSTWRLRTHSQPQFSNTTNVNRALNPRSPLLSQQHASSTRFSFPFLST